MRYFRDSSDLFKFSEKLLQIAISYAASSKTQQVPEYVENAPIKQTFSKDGKGSTNEMTLQVNHLILFSFL